MKHTYTIRSSDAMVALGRQLGAQLRGGEVIELVSDLGGGKTTLTRGLASGFGSKDTVASPSFTINFVYSRDDGKQLYHFDFYRLNEGGVVASELAEVIGDPEVVVVVEWGELVHDVLPSDKVTITIAASDTDNEREVTIEAAGTQAYLLEGIAV